MKLKEMIEKVLRLIEEYDEDNPLLTADPDVSSKIKDVINQVMFELARMKKIPKYVELPVKMGDLIDFAAIENACGYEIYQISLIGGVNCSPKASGTVYKVLEDGTAEIEVFVYPERITADTKDTYEFELTPDVLEVMPYGVAGDLLKSDVSAQYGNIYSARYESMLQRLDPRYAMMGIYIEGGVPS